MQQLVERSLRRLLTKDLGEKKCKHNFILIGIMGLLRFTVLKLLNEEIMM